MMQTLLKTAEEKKKKIVGHLLYSYFVRCLKKLACETVVSTALTRAEADL